LNFETKPRNGKRVITTEPEYSEDSILVSQPYARTMPAPVHLFRRFAGRFKLVPILVFLWCSLGIIPRGAFAQSPADPAAQSENSAHRPAKTYELVINIKGKLYRVHLTLGVLGLATIVMLAGLLAVAVVFAIVARRRAKDAEAANRKLESEIIERKRAEEEIRTLNADLERRRAEETFRGLLEAAPDAMVIVDAEGKIVLVNSQTEKLFGYARQDLLGKNVEMLMPERFSNAGEGHRGGYFTDTRDLSTSAELDLSGLHQDGHEFPMEIRLSPIHTEDGMLFSNSIRDVTERKRFETTLQEKNVELEKANRFKDQFLANMSHELRTPLNAIIGFTGTLLMRLPGPLTPDQEKHLRTVQSSSKHLLSLINDLLDLAKVEAGKVQLTREPVKGREVLEEITSSLLPLAQSKGIVLALTASSDDGLLQTDRRALHQILLNLANNAIKFTETGSVRLGMRQLDENGAAFMEFEVTDTGCGIPPEAQDRLFQAFTQVNGAGGRRQEGTGLGLYLSRRLAELLAGRITFESGFEKGSTFRLTLPLSPG
jgi:PAS domain S-box-containing protein